MTQRSRREFLRDVGTGVVVASVGSSLAADLGFSLAFADQGPERLTFGQLEPLVSLMQETPAARLIPLVVERLRQGQRQHDPDRRGGSRQAAFPGAVGTAIGHRYTHRVAGAAR